MLLDRVHATASRGVATFPSIAQVVRQRHALVSRVRHATDAAADAWAADVRAAGPVVRRALADHAATEHAVTNRELDADGRVHRATDYRVASAVVRRAMSVQATPGERQRPTVRPHSVVIARLPHATDRTLDSNRRTDEPDARVAGSVQRRGAVTNGELDTEGRVSPTANTGVAGPVVRTSASERSTSVDRQLQRPTVRPHSVVVTRLPPASQHGLDSNERITEATDTRVARPVARRAASHDAIPGDAGAGGLELDADRATDVAGPAVRRAATDRGTPRGRQRPTVGPHSIVISRLPHALHHNGEPDARSVADQAGSDDELDADRRARRATHVDRAVVRRAPSDHGTPRGRQRPTVRPHSVSITRLPYALHPSTDGESDIPIAGGVVRRAVSDHATPRERPTVRPHSIASLPQATDRQLDANRRVDGATDGRVTDPLVRRGVSDHATPRELPAVRPHGIVISRLPQALHPTTHVEFGPEGGVGSGSGRDSSRNPAGIPPRSSGGTNPAQIGARGRLAIERGRGARRSVAAPMIVARSLAGGPRSGRDPSRNPGRIAPRSSDGTDRAQIGESEGPTPTPTPAEVFVAELQRHRAERPRPLPRHYQPLATAIVGDRPVRVASGEGSRRALSKVGKAAATTGDVIHVSTPRPTAEVIAHELTHVAHPSPVPRFFDDDDHSPEERRAEQVAAVMRRAPIAPRPSPSSTVSAAALASSITIGDTVQRKVTLGSHRATVPAPPLPPTVVPLPTPTTPPPPDVVAAPDDTARQATSVDAQFDRILELLEDRILTELERRGGRFRGGF